MKLVKLLALALTLNGCVAQQAVAADSIDYHQSFTHIPDSVFGAQALTIEHLNAQRIQTAQDEYTFEATWAPTVRYAALGAVTAIAAYGFYTWWKNPKISRESIEYFNRLPDDAKRDLTLTAADLIKSMEATIKSQSQAKSWEIWAADNGTSILSWAAFYSGIAALQGINGYAQGALTPFVPRIPTSGNLQWFITNRTDYERNVTDIQRYFRHYTLFNNEINEVMQLMVHDIEKIVAYLQHFNENLSSQAYIKAHAHLVEAACKRYTKNIKQLTDEVVDALNSQEELPLVAEKLGLVLGEINSAKLFVTTYHN